MSQRKLPSLQTLAVFEEVVRRRSCTDTALRLGMTQGAVSKQIRAMESFVGVQLFARTSSGLIPNAYGVRLIEDMRPLLDGLERACERAAREAEGRQVVIMRVLASVADRWLLPRLSRFRAAHPNIDVQFSTFLTQSDFDRGGEEIEVRFGAGTWMDADATPILGQRRLLVAPPGTPPDLPLSVLLAMPRFIHAQSPDVWQEFFSARGLSYDGMRPAQKFDIFQVLIAGVKAGLGVALVADFFVQDDLARGDLVNPGGYAHESRLSYHLVTPHRAKPLSPAARTLRDWILAEARATEYHAPTVQPEDIGKSRKSAASANSR